MSLFTLFTLNNAIKTESTNVFLLCLNLAASHYSLVANHIHLASNYVGVNQKTYIQTQLPGPNVIPNHFHVSPTVFLIQFCNIRINH